MTPENPSLYISWSFAVIPAQVDNSLEEDAMDGVFHDTAAATSFSAAKMNKVSLFASPRMFCDIYCLEPGQEQRPHHHAGNDKVYYALTGTCRVTVGGEMRPLRPGQVAIAPAGTDHGVRNDSAQRATLLVIMAPHPDSKG